MTTKQKEEAAKVEPVVEVAPVDTSQCVADDGKPHVGKAVMGRVCSYHAMWYRPDGTRRP